MTVIYIKERRENNSQKLNKSTHEIQKERVSLFLFKKKSVSFTFANVAMSVFCFVLLS